MKKQLSRNSSWSKIREFYAALHDEMMESIDDLRAYRNGDDD